MQGENEGIDRRGKVVGGGKAGGKGGGEAGGTNEEVCDSTETVKGHHQ